MKERTEAKQKGLPPYIVRPE